MSCERFEALLFETLDGRLDAGEADALDRHIARCARCAELRRLLGDGSGDRLEPPGALLDEIVAAAGIEACAVARDRLADAGPGALDALDPVLGMHVASCARCAARHRALTKLGEDLPALAETSPPPSLLDDVIAMTTGASRAAGWWARLLVRPRLALEGAYVGTLVLVLSLGTPAAAISRLPGSLLDELRHDRLGVRSRLADGWTDVSRAGADGWGRLSGQIHDYLDAAPEASELGERTARGVTSWWSEVSRRWRQVWVRLVDALIARVHDLMDALGWPAGGREQSARAARSHGGVTHE